MPSGLHNAAQTLQRFIDEVLRGLHFTYAYIDDVLIASGSPEEHEDHLYIKCINPAKCKFGASELEFLGHKVDKLKHGIRPLEE